MANIKSTDMLFLEDLLEVSRAAETGETFVSARDLFPT